MIMALSAFLWQDRERVFFIYLCIICTTALHILLHSWEIAKDSFNASQQRYKKFRLKYSSLSLALI